MKRLVLLSLVLSVACGLVYSADPFDEFKNNVEVSGTATQAVIDAIQKDLDNFTKDIGAVISGGSFRQGKSLGLPGFDIGVHVPVKNVGSDNTIIKKAGLSLITYPVLQVEIGLPSKVDLLVRYSSVLDSSLSGGGIRYGILKNSFPGLPSVCVQALYNTLTVDSGVNKFSANTISFQAAASISLPVVTPYIGLSLDSTTLTPDSFLNLPKSGMEGKASGYRVEGGVNLSLIPFTYLTLGGGYINGDTGYNVGLGADISF